MKRVIKAPLSQVIWARIYMLTSLISSILLLGLVITFFFVLGRSEIVFGIIALLLCLLLFSSGIYASIIYFKRAWAKVIIKENEISLVCPFLKDITLNVQEIRKLAIRNEGNVSFVLLTSERNFPFVDTEKIESKEGLIKFYLTEDYKNALLELLTPQLTKPLRKN